MRDFILAANWKMHKTPKESAAFFRDFLPALKAGSGNRRVIFFVPATNMVTSEEATRGSTVELGAQNVHSEVKGAFTGETSVETVKAIGAKWALVGHSERRTLFHETDADAAKKVKAGLAAGLDVMLCIGETLAEREAGKTMDVVRRQLERGLELVAGDTVKSQPKRISIAYEPVWAIGTGKVATPEQASEVHQFLRKTMTELYGAASANAITILYGGSAKADNVASLVAQKDIDGFLVGGASLEVASFSALIENAKPKT